MTEIYDYLRLLWARIGKPHCHNCGAPIPGQSLEQITDRVLTLAEGTRFMVMAPVVRGRKGEYGRLLEEMRAQGYARARIDGELRRLDEPIELDKKFKHDISVVVDRLVMKEGVRKRLSESVEAASQLADGLVEIETARWPSCDRPGRARRRCRGRGRHGDAVLGALRLPQLRHLDARARAADLLLQLAPRLLPALPRARLPARDRPRADRPRPDPVDLARGRSSRGRRPPRSTTGGCSRRSPRRTGSTSTPPGRTCPRRDRELLLEGTGDERHTVSYRNRFGRRRVYTVRFDGMLASLERRYENTDSENTRERIEGLMALQPCPACGGARLRPESLAVTVGGLNIYEYTRLRARAALEWIEALELTETERAIARLVVREIAERLRFLDSVGIGYLSLERAAATLSGGEAQRIRLATQIGSWLVGVLYILDEPSIGLHQRDNAKLIDTLERLRDLGNTVIVVEHDEGTIRAADHVVDLGPGAGEHGGEVVAEGTPAQIARQAGSLTGQYLTGKRQHPGPGAAPQRRAASWWSAGRASTT